MWSTSGNDKLSRYRFSRETGNQREKWLKSKGQTEENIADWEKAYGQS
jgi:hypothetical protein